MTFDKLLKNWISENNLKASVGYDRFGKSTYWSWINGLSIPSDNKIPEISDKTGISVNVITSSINESRKNIEAKKKKRTPIPAPSTRTLGKMLGEWMEINNVTRKYAREVFGFGFDKWILDQCLPADGRVSEISNKTGYTEAEISEGMRLTKEYMRYVKDGRKQVEKFNKKYNTEPLVDGHDDKEVIEEAEAVRKLKDALTREDIAKSHTASDEQIRQMITEARSGDSFDTLIDSYAEKKSARDRLSEQIKQLSKAIEDIDTELKTLKDKIRRAA